MCETACVAPVAPVAPVWWLVALTVWVSSMPGTGLGQGQAVAGGAGKLHSNTVKLG